MGNFVQGKLKEQIQQLFDKGNACYEQGDKQGAIRMLDAVWDALPEDKSYYDEGYLAMQHAINVAIEIHDMDALRRWEERIFSAGQAYEDLGERDLMTGMIAYETGDFEKALLHLKLADEKSFGRCFGDCEKKYQAFLYEQRD